MQNKIDRRELFETKESWAFPAAIIGALIASAVLILLFFSDPRARPLFDMLFK